MKRIYLLFLIFLTFSLVAENVRINDNKFSIDLISSETDHFVLEYNIGSFQREALQIDGQLFYSLSLENEPLSFDKGAPSLPFITRSLIIPDNALMQVTVIESDYVEFKMPVLPSKGILLRTVDPATVPYTFSDIYSTDAFYPANLATLGEPYILRDFRGITVKVQPFQYNPVTGILRVYTNLVLEVHAMGIDNRNIKLRIK